MVIVHAACFDWVKQKCQFGNLHGRLENIGHLYHSKNQPTSNTVEPAHFQHGVGLCSGGIDNNFW